MGQRSCEVKCGTLNDPSEARFASLIPWYDQNYRTLRIRVTSPVCARSLRPQAGFGSPRPNAGEGSGVRGNPIEWISTRNPALDEGFGALQDQSAVCSLPRWGEWNRSRLSFSSDNEFRHFCDPEQ